MCRGAKCSNYLINEKKEELCLIEQSCKYKIVMRVAEGGRMEGV